MDFQDTVPPVTPAEPQAPVRKSRRGGCFAVIIVLAVMIGLVALAIAAGIAALMGEDDVAESPGLAQGPYGRDDVPELREVWSTGRGGTKAVRIPISGMIMLDSAAGWRMGSPGTAQSALQSIRRATHDTEVKALILEIDSGGGGITASDILYAAVKEFKARDPERVVVSLFGDVGASGAYYIALASDVIMAHPTTMTGSIGVLLKSYDLRGLAEKVGVKDVTIKSGENKDILNPLKELSEAQEKMLQGVVDALHDRFVTLVAKERDLPEVRVRELADGRIFLAEEAIELGLVDVLGYSVDAFAMAAERLSVEELKVYRYEVRFSLGDLLRSPGLLGQAWLGIAPRHDARAMYRWML